MMKYTLSPSAHMIPLFVVALMLCFLWTLGCSEANAFGAPDAPVAINADSLEILQPEQRAIFKGNVIAKQGGMTLYANQMTVYYDQTKQAENSSLGALDYIEVIGNVRLKTPDESATASRGRFDAVKEKLFLYGDVVLRRGENVLHGSKLEYHVTTGNSLLSGGAGTGAPKNSSTKPPRVRGVFTPNRQ